ncbi:MAG: GtrA family protein [Aestuariivirga sp.]
MSDTSNAYKSGYGAPSWLPPKFAALMRFGCVGLAGLTADLACFTALHAHDVSPLVARVFSLAFATLVTWRLNRAVTYADSGRQQSGEAFRYLCVTGLAQGFSYLVFAVLIHAFPALMPQLALMAGAASAALLSFEGHRIFSFARRNS